MNGDYKRLTIINKAIRLYIDTGITNNITEALAAYLDNDAGPDEQIPLFITSPEIHLLEKVLQERRPRCDDCNAELYLQVNARDPGGKEYPTAWICKTCGIEYYSDKSPKEWLKELQDETRKQNLENAHEPDKTGVPVMRPAPEI
ncbi:MAG: hypothetical protein KKF33_20485 [Alphaproteobacteria bacterium]|nr:hypothetical protein [Alphaproteobacteria bacterium]